MLLDASPCNTRSSRRPSGYPENLDSLLSDFQLELGVLSNQLTHHYFSHTVASVS